MFDIEHSGFFVTLSTGTYNKVFTEVKTYDTVATLYDTVYNEVHISPCGMKYDQHDMNNEAIIEHQIKYIRHKNIYILMFTLSGITCIRASHIVDRLHSRSENQLFLASSSFVKYGEQFVFSSSLAFSVVGEPNKLCDSLIYI